MSVTQTRLRETRAGTRPTVGPQSIGVVLTNACNLNCVTCWTYSPLRKERPRLEWVRKRLTRATLSRLFAEAAVLKTERVIFTGGGDPLAHPDFEAIAADAKASGLKVTLISNLTLVRDPDRFLSLEVDTLLANFSSADAASYVAFHPNRTEADFPKLLALLRQMAQTRTQVKLVFVVCAVNASVLPQLVDIAGELRAAIQLKMMSVTEETRSLAISGEQRATILQNWDSLRARADAAGVVVNWETFGAELRGEDVTRFPIEETGCYAGHYYARVTADAGVFFCCNQHPDLKIGSLHTTTFAELWQSERWQAIREQLRADQYVAGCEQCGKFDLNRKVRQQLTMG